MIYVSFSGDDGWLGGVYMATAATPDDVRFHKANPGGEAMCFVMNDASAARVPVVYRDRLLTREELQTVSTLIGDGEVVSVNEYEREHGPMRKPPVICEKHNRRQS